jgi:hypothetical protein
MQVKQWLRDVDFKRKAAPAARFSVYERALKQLPGRSVGRPSPLALCLAIITTVPTPSRIACVCVCV